MTRDALIGLLFCSLWAVPEGSEISLEYNLTFKPLPLNIKKVKQIIVVYVSEALVNDNLLSGGVSCCSIFREGIHYIVMAQTYLSVMTHTRV